MKKNRLKIITILTFGLILSGMLLQTGWCSLMTEKPERIKWYRTYQKQDVTYIPGIIATAKGSFNCYWKGERNNWRLMAKTSTSGELPAEEEALYLESINSKLVAIYREKQALNNRKEQPELRKIAVVKSKDLLSVIKKFKLPVIAPASNETVSIVWNKPFLKDNVTYITGRLALEWGTFEICWRIEGLQAQLITRESRGGAELPARETKLFLLADSKTGQTRIFKERIPLNNSQEVPVLINLVTVSTEELYQPLL